MNTPTPRTDAAWSASFEPCEYRAAHTARTMRDCSQQLETELAALATECDQLRAEVEQKRDLLVIAIRSAGDQATRAERAEAAETVALANWNGALERAMKAEADLVALAQCHDDNCRAVDKFAAELAAERARLDSGTILLTVAGERVWHCGVDLRAAIDAGVKEGAK